MRNTNKSEIQRAFDYFCKGLTAREVGLLLNVSYRTIQNYMIKDKWREKRAEILETEKKKVIRAYEREMKKINIGKKSKRKP